MAGFPIRTAQLAYLDECEIEVFEARAGGASWRLIAQQFMTSAHVLSKWIKATPERSAAWYALDEVAAESKAGIAEEILEGVDTIPGSSEDVRLAIAKSDLAKWHAGVLNRPRFGAPSAHASVTVNLGGLHLTAVRELAKNPPPAPASLIGAPIEDADFEIVTEPTLEELLGVE